MRDIGASPPRSNTGFINQLAARADQHVWVQDSFINGSNRESRSTPVKVHTNAAADLIKSYKPLEMVYYRGESTLYIEALNHGLDINPRITAESRPFLSPLAKTSVSFPALSDQTTRVSSTHASASGTTNFHGPLVQLDPSPKQRNALYLRICTYRIPHK